LSNNRFRILCTLSLVAILALTVLPSTLSASANRFTARAEVPPPGVSAYTEDFTTTTYRAGATTAAGWGTGTVTSSRDYSVTQLGSYATSSPVYSIDVQGRTAYAVLYNASSASQTLRTFDLTDPSHIKYLGHRDSNTRLGAGEVDGDVLYVGTDYQGTYCWLATYNVSNAYSIPAPLDSLQLGDGNITDLAVQGHFLYVSIHGSTGNDFTIVDVEDPSNIRVVGGIGFSDLYGVDIRGQLVYLADGTLGLYIRNVTNPYSTTAVGSRNTPGVCTDVLVDGNLAFVADGPTGVQIIDISTPSTPVIIGACDTPGNARRLALQGHTLFVADGAGGLQVVDVANPAHPSNVTTISLPYTYDVALYGGDVVAATASGIYTLRIAKGLAMLPVVGTYSGGYEFWDVRVQGDIAYVAAGADGLLTLNVSDPASPVLLDQYNAGVTFCRKLDVQGHLAFVADYGGGIRVFDVSDPTDIKPTDSSGLTYATDVCVAGEVAYVADGTYGVYIYNASNPYSLSLITFVDPGAENVTALWVQGYHLYVATQVASGYGLLIYDIRNISSPTLIYRWSVGTVDHYDVFVDGDVLYIADGVGYVVCWNVTDPFASYYSDWIHYDQKPTGVWGFGPYMLATVYGWGTVLINATDINDLVILANCTSTATALQVTVHGDYAYVANRGSLVILRLFQSAGATYATGCVAESLTVDSTTEVIVNATLNPTVYLPPLTGISWQLSADGGAHWEAVTPGVLHAFTNTGSDLRWRATFTTSVNDRTAFLHGLSVTYGHMVITTSLPPPIPGFPAIAIAVGAALSLGLVLALRQRKQRKQ
jgi:hypothetical protein